MAQPEDSECCWPRALPPILASEGSQLRQMPQTRSNPELQPLAPVAHQSALNSRTARARAGAQGADQP
jgi:hypothetical protein